jgi:hypothetical protein
VRRLEEEVETGKELLDQAKKATEESREEYEVNNAPLNGFLVPT